MLAELGISPGDLTGGFVAVFSILMLLTGRLWTNKAYQEKCKESERNRKAYETERDSRIALNSQNAELFELAKTTHNLLVAMFGDFEQSNKSGGAHRAVEPSKRW